MLFGKNELEVSQKVSNFFLVFFTIFFISCSDKRVIFLEDYSLAKLEQGDKPHQTKYNISINLSQNCKINLLQNITSKIPNIKIAKNNLDYRLNLICENRVVAGQKFNFAKLEIWNVHANFLEDQIPIFDNQINFNELKRYFPIRGYVVRKLTNRNDEVIFAVNFGENIGVEKNMKVSVYRYEDYQRFLSNAESKHYLKIAVGYIFKTAENESFFYVTSGDLNQIQKWDKVILENGNFGNYMEDGAKILENNEELLENKIKF